MPCYKLLILDTKDIIYDDNYSPIWFHETNTLHNLKNIGQCMIVNSCNNPKIFEKEFLSNTVMCAHDFEVHYIYGGDYLYIPKISKKSKIFRNFNQETKKNLQKPCHTSRITPEIQDGA